MTLQQTTLKKINLNGKSIAAFADTDLLLEFYAQTSRAQSKAKTKAKRLIDYVNPLIGTAPLPDKKCLGHNSAPGEELYYVCVNPRCHGA